MDIYEISIFVCFLFLLLGYGVDTRFFVVPIFLLLWMVGTLHGIN